MRNEDLEETLIFNYVLPKSSFLNPYSLDITQLWPDKYFFYNGLP
jgi:hypothetical protein